MIVMVFFTGMDCSCFLDLHKVCEGLHSLRTHLLGKQGRRRRHGCPMVPDRFSTEARFSLSKKMLVSPLTPVSHAHNSMTWPLQTLLKAVQP